MGPRYVFDQNLIRLLCIHPPWAFLFYSKFWIDIVEIIIYSGGSGALKGWEDPIHKTTGHFANILFRQNFRRRVNSRRAQSNRADYSLDFLHVRRRSAPVFSIKSWRHLSPAQNDFHQHAHGPRRAGRRLARHFRHCRLRYAFFEIFPDVLLHARRYVSSVLTAIRWPERQRSRNFARLAVESVHFHRQPR